MQEPNPARFTDIIHTNNEQVEKLHHEIYELTQKLTLYRDFLIEHPPLIERLKLFEDSHDPFTKYLTSSFPNINAFLTDAWQL